MPLLKRRGKPPDLQEVRSGPPNLAELRRECRDVIAQLGLSHPEEDWIPTAWYYGPGGPGMAAFDIDASDLRSALEDFLAKERAMTWGFWATTWMVDADEAVSGIRASEHPDRFEALVLQLQTERERALDFARIQRSEDRPPTLGTWEIQEEG